MNSNLDAEHLCDEHANKPHSQQGSGSKSFSVIYFSDSRTPSSLRRRTFAMGWKTAAIVTRINRFL